MSGLRGKLGVSSMGRALALACVCVRKESYSRSRPRGQYACHKSTVDVVGLFFSVADYIRRREFPASKPGRLFMTVGNIAVTASQPVQCVYRPRLLICATRDMQTPDKSTAFIGGRNLYSYSSSARQKYLITRVGKRGNRLKDATLVHSITLYVDYYTLESLLYYYFNGTKTGSTSAVQPIFNKYIWYNIFKCHLLFSLK